MQERASVPPRRHRCSFGVRGCQLSATGPFQSRSDFFTPAVPVTVTDVLLHDGLSSKQNGLIVTRYTVALDYEHRLKIHVTYLLGLEPSVVLATSLSHFLQHKPGIKQVQALADISRSALCCHSNETRANPLNSAQPEGTPYHSPKSHPGSVK